MKINSPVIVIYILLTLVPISYCMYLNAEMRNAIEDYRSLQSKAFVLEDKADYEGLTNYSTGFSDGYATVRLTQTVLGMNSASPSHQAHDHQAASKRRQIFQFIGLQISVCAFQ